MQGNSRAVLSRQCTLHPRLAEVVDRHLAHRWQAPIAQRSQQCFEQLQPLLLGWHQHWVLDAGCGTGASTVAMAAADPERLYLGLDKSATRLACNEVAAGGWLRRDNLLLAHMDVVDFWRLAADAGLRASAQTLFYPNPWPKPAHLRRRWHGHPVWPQLLALGGQLELRSNWRLYVAEFAAALQISGHQVEVEELRVAGEPCSPFERKYIASAHALWRLRVELSRGCDSREPPAACRT